MDPRYRNARLDDRLEAQESILNNYPSLRAMYTTGPNGNTAVYYFQDATATIFFLLPRTCDHYILRRYKYPAGHRKSRCPAVIYRIYSFS